MWQGAGDDGFVYFPGPEKAHKVRKHRRTGSEIAAYCSLKHGYVVVKIHDRNVIFDDPF
jgi:hypothetical protein